MIFLRKSPSLVYWLGDKLYLNITNRCSNDCYCMHTIVTIIELFARVINEIESLLFHFFFSRFSCVLSVSFR